MQPLLKQPIPRSPAMRFAQNFDVMLDPFYGYHKICAQCQKILPFYKDGLPGKKYCSMKCFKASKL